VSLKDAAVKADTRGDNPSATVAYIKKSNQRASTGPSNDGKRNITCPHCN